MDDADRLTPEQWAESYDRLLRTLRSQEVGYHHRYLMVMTLAQQRELAKLNKAILKKNAKIARLKAAIREAEERGRREEAVIWEYAVERHVGGSATRSLVKDTANDPEYRAKAIEARGKEG